MMSAIEIYRNLTRSGFQTYQRMLREEADGTSVDPTIPTIKTQGKRQRNEDEGTMHFGGRKGKKG